jgi:hypothetical protein
MGREKEELIRIEELAGRATNVALRAGALRLCPLQHADIVLRTYDYEAAKLAYAIGTKMVTTGEVKATREQFMGAIKTAIEQAPETCWRCAKLRDE